MSWSKIEPWVLGLVLRHVELINNRVMGSYVRNKQVLTPMSKKILGKKIFLKCELYRNLINPKFCGRAK